MEDALPDFEPLMLSALSYGQAIQQMRATGCSVRRPHWCAPVLLIDHDRIVMDDEGELTAWEPTPEDKRARDWSMVPTQPPSPDLQGRE